MSATPPAPPVVPDLDAQKALVKRARRDSWHWTFRAVLLALIGGLAVRNGWLLFSILFGLLALMSVHVSRSTRRRAAELAARIRMLEGKP